MRIKSNSLVWPLFLIQNAAEDHHRQTDRENQADFLRSNDWRDIVQLHLLIPLLGLCSSIAIINPCALSDKSVAILIICGCVNAHGHTCWQGLQLKLCSYNNSIQMCVAKQENRKFRPLRTSPLKLHFEYHCHYSIKSCILWYQFSILSNAIKITKLFWADNPFSDAFPMWQIHAIFLVTFHQIGNWTAVNITTLELAMNLTI